MSASITAQAPVIKGTTKILGIMGDPIAQVMAPTAFNEIAVARGIDAVCIPWHVHHDDLAVTFGALRAMKNAVGMIITLPHKITSMPFMDELTPRAKLVGAINLIKRDANGRLIGDIVDGVGFVKGLIKKGHSPKGYSVFIAGAGGAGTALAFALADAGVAAITIFDIDPAKMTELVERLAAAYPDIAVAIGTNHPGGHSLVINATPLGMKPTDLLPIDPVLLDKGSLAAEVVMKPHVTAFLTEAAKRGHDIQPGHFVLDEQMEFWLEWLF